MSGLTAGFVLTGGGLAVLAWLAWRREVAWRVAASLVLGLLAAVALASSGYSFWYHHRRPPEPAQIDLFDGVTYTREIRRSPRPMVVHVVRINLCAPGIGFLVTPPDHCEGRQYRARTTSQFLREFGAQVAINGSLFKPWPDQGPLPFRPRVGDPVDATGLTMSQGIIVSPPRDGEATLWLTADSLASIGAPPGSPHNALSGSPVLLRGGQAAVAPGGKPHPRTAAALDWARGTLLLVVVDGRQPNCSEGATLGELAQIVRDHGGDVALNLDGGGSSTLVAEGPDGEPVVLNSPIHGRVPPGRERPVANHLGVFAKPR